MRIVDHEFDKSIIIETRIRAYIRDQKKSDHVLLRFFDFDLLVAFWICSGLIMLVTV